MTRSVAGRWGLVALVLLVGVAGSVVGARVAVRILRDRLAAALGPDAEIQALSLGWSTVEVAGLRLGGGPTWPTRDALRAERVVIVPRWRTFLSERIEIEAVTVVRPYLSALRARDGALQVAPGFLARSAPADGVAPPLPARAVAIARLVILDGVAELFDATVSEPPLRVRLESVEATVRDVVAPSLAGRITFDGTAVVKGVGRDGRADISGWMEAATGDASATTRLRGLDLVALQPYLVRAAEVRVQRGSMDLDLQSEIHGQRLRAPGRVVLADLELAPDRGARDTFMGVPRAVVLSFLRDQGNRIDVSFVLQGDIHDPQFVLEEALATRLALAMAERLGVSIQGLVEGVRGLGRKGLEAAGGAAKGLGGALRQLPGGSPKP